MPNESGNSQRMLILGNALLQLVGDPRPWPRDLKKPREKLLWRRIRRVEAEDWPPPGTPKGKIERLRALAEAQYDETRLWFLLTTELYALGALIAGAAFLFPSVRVGLTGIAVACQMLAAFARIRAGRLQVIAHEADWRALLLDGLGPTEAELEQAAVIENRISDGARRRAGMLPDYYTSRAAPGDRRLVDNLRQTAYIRSALYGGARVQAVFVAAFVILIPLTPPAYWLITGDSLPPEAGVLAVTAVLPLWDVFGRVRGWDEAATTLERVFASLVGPEDMRRAVALMIDAMTVTAMAPPIPSSIHARWFKEGLRERWMLVSATSGRHPEPELE